MKRFGVAIVKNEADVVEAFVRHALHHLDRLVVVDHRSDDATPGILAGLRDEGLALSMHRFEDVAFDPARWMGDAPRRPGHGRVDEGAPPGRAPVRPAPAHPPGSLPALRGPVGTRCVRRSRRMAAACRRLPGGGQTVGIGR